MIESLGVSLLMCVKFLGLLDVMCERMAQESRRQKSRRTLDVSMVVANVCIALHPLTLGDVLGAVLFLVWLSSS